MTLFNRSLFSIILICFALGTCMAYGSRDIETKSNSHQAIPPEASQFSESEQPIFSSPSEAPGLSPTSEQGFGHSSSSFSAAFSDILKGTFRGHSLTMPDQINSKNKHISKALEQICGHTDYPNICVSTCLPFLSHKFDVKNVLEASIKACSYQIKFTISKITKYSASSPELATSLADCRNQYSNALENLQRALDAIPSRDLGTCTIMLSAVIADVSACESGFEDMKIKSSSTANTEGLVSITASNCLAIASLIPH